MRSLGRAFRRGHATINKSEIFGPQVIIRNGRGNLQHLSGEKFVGKPIMPEFWPFPMGKPSATGNHRKKPRSITMLYVYQKSTPYNRKGKRIIFPVD